MLPRLPRRQQQLIVLLLTLVAIWYIRTRSAAPSGAGNAAGGYWKRPPVSLSDRKKTKTKNDPPRNTVVLASKAGDDTSWIEEDLPEWDYVVYTSRKSKNSLGIDTSNGREANAYVKYIVDNYDSLSDVTVFVHGHRETYHVDRAFSSNPNSIRRLSLENVKKVGYQSLSCWSPKGCAFGHGSFWDATTNSNLKTAFPALFGVEMPAMVSGPLYAQFAVSKEAVQARPKSYYQDVYSWLNDDPMESYIKGWVMEHTWHYMFGKDAVHCQVRSQCLCSAFKLCDRKRPEVMTALKAYGYLDEEPDQERRAKNMKGASIFEQAKAAADGRKPPPMPKSKPEPERDEKDGKEKEAGGDAEPVKDPKPKKEPERDRGPVEESDEKQEGR